MPLNQQDHIAARRLYERQLVQKRLTAHHQATAAQKRDPSDPFLYARTYSRVMNGIEGEYAFGGAE